MGRFILDVGNLESLRVKEVCEALNTESTSGIMSINWIAETRYDIYQMNRVQTYGGHLNE